MYKARKSIFVFLTVIIILFGPLNSIVANEIQDACTEIEVAKIQQNTALDNMQCKSCILIEANSGTVLFENNSEITRPIASVTKVMSMLLFMEAIDKENITYDTVVTVSQYAADMGGSQAYIEAGEQFTVDEMLKAVAVHSSNDVTVSLAEHIAGSELAFVGMMNDKAEELGLKNTVYSDCTGLNDSDQYSCAYDIAMISRELVVKYPDILRYTSIWHDTFRNGTFSLDNTNKLIRFYNGCDGLKTGFTSAAGFNLSATAERNGMRVISVVLGNTDSKTRFAETSKLLDYGFANFEVYKGVSDGEWPQQISITGGTKKSVSVSPDTDENVIINKKIKKSISTQIVYHEEIELPLQAGDEVGYIAFIYNDGEIGRYRILSDEDVGKLTFGWIFKELLIRMFKTAVGNPIRL